MRRTIVTLAVVGACAVGAAAAPGMTASAPAPKKITSKGVGQVKLGKTFATLRQQHLVGKLRTGCELAPNTRTARLRSPLNGSVNFSQSNPRKANDITIRGGAEARGVGIGDTIADIKAAFPKRKVDHSQESVFGLTFVHVPKRNGVQIQFAVDVNTKKITLIGVPFIALCE
jgi:hypothetical protein